MKKILFGLFTLCIANFCNAQKIDKKDTIKFTPPVIKKNKPAKKKHRVKFTPPVIVEDKKY